MTVLKKNIFFTDLNRLNSFEDKPHVAVGVSGGPDSMCLVFIINEWINFKPKTDLNDGIKSFVEWYKEYYST